MKLSNTFLGQKKTLLLAYSLFTLALTACEQETGASQNYYTPKSENITYTTENTSAYNESSASSHHT